MEQIILIAHLLVALAIIGLIMLQQGKGADMGASFGAGASQTLFGSDGSGNVLTRATSWLVALFFASSFSLALLANQKSSPVDELDLDLEIPATAEAQVEAVSEEFPLVEEDVPAIESSAATLSEEFPLVEEDVPVDNVSGDDLPDVN